MSVAQHPPSATANWAPASIHHPQILLAIKLVKFYVWERSFAKQVEEVSHGTFSAPKAAFVPICPPSLACAAAVYRNPIFCKAAPPQSHPHALIPINRPKPPRADPR